MLLSLSPVTDLSITFFWLQSDGGRACTIKWMYAQWLLHLHVLFFPLLYILSFVPYDAFWAEFSIFSINITASALFLFIFTLYLFLSYCFNICVLFNFNFLLSSIPGLILLFNSDHKLYFNLCVYLIYRLFSVVLRLGSPNFSYFQLPDF